MMRYLIDDRNAEPEMSQELYRFMVTWAGSYGDRFLINVNRLVYDDPDELEQFISLGEVVSAPGPPVDNTFLGRAFAKLFGPQEDIIRVQGKADESFIQSLTSKGAPAKAVSGDVSPVEDVIVFIADRPLYASYDYGRTQVLELTQEELESLRKGLESQGLDSGRLIPAPPYVSD